MTEPDLDAVVQREYEPLVRLLTLRVGDVHVAEELAQDALAELVSRWPLPQGTPERWLTVVALNRSRSWWRRRYAEARAWRRHGPTPDSEQAPPTSDQLAVHRALARLPERQQRALLLRFFQGCSVAETAAALGCAEGTVKSLTHRALARLRRDGGLVEEEVDV